MLVFRGNQFTNITWICDRLMRMKKVPKNILPNGGRHDGDESSHGIPFSAKKSPEQQIQRFWVPRGDWGSLRIPFGKIGEPWGTVGKIRGIT